MIKHWNRFGLMVSASLFAGMLFFLSSCSEDSDGEYISVEGISLSENKIEICRIGEQFRIEPIIIPENATNKKVTYLSFNEGIVSVDADGLATIVGEGSTVIQVETKDGGKRAYIFLNVKLEKLEQNSVMTMYYDETKKFVSDFIPPECNITFSNLNIYDILDETTVDEIVYISNDGFIKAKMPGSVRFIANANDATTHYAENVFLRILPRPLSRESARFYLVGKGYDFNASYFHLNNNSWSYFYRNGTNIISYSGKTWDVSDSDGDGDYSSGTVVCIRDDDGVFTQSYRNLTVKSVSWY